MSSMVEELESLLFDWEAGTLDDQGVERVRKLLRSEPEAREFYLRHQLINAALKLDVEAGIESAVEQTSAVSLSTTGAGTGANAFRGKVWWTLTAAALLICVLAGRVVYLESSDEQPPALSNAGMDGDSRDASREAKSSGVALLTRLVDVEWTSPEADFVAGDSLPPGRIALASGYVQIEFFCGATVVVEGPAELDLESATHARVHRGRLRAQVPPAARGFSLEVDDMKVVDLGTEFGLAVSAEGANLQVFDGEVELFPTNEASQVLAAGQAISRNDRGDYERSRVTPDRFLDIAALDARADGQQAARYENWMAWSNELRSDPRLIAYYAFDQQGGWKRKLRSGVEPDNNELDGAIVGARRVRGRWPDKSGLEFKRPADRVRVQIPGEFDSLTFACWVKIDSLDRWYNSLFLTDGYNQGEPHWQILDTGQLFFSVRHRPDEIRGPNVGSPAHQKVLSPPFWKPSLSGRWLHLATTYNADLGRVAHYLNGKPIHEEDIDQELIVSTTRIGAASIGNWSIPTRPDEEFAVRNLNGTIDEFAVFAAALSPDEIKEIYDNGNP